MFWTEWVYPYCSFYNICCCIMDRGSCPNLYDDYDINEQTRESWISAFNKVNGKEKSSRNTVTIAEVRGKPSVNSVFARAPNHSYNDLHDQPHFNRKIISNGHDILSLTHDSIMNMSLSDAHETLFQLRVEGNIKKKGFKRLKLWKLRFFVLSGKMIKYFEVLIL